jgi:hypothetical protein
MRASMAWPRRRISACASGRGSPEAMRSCHSTRSIPVTISVTGCSTWSRVFISMNQNSRAGLTMNSTVPAFRYFDRPRRVHGGVGDALARRLVEQGRGRFLDDLLVAALRGAFALPEMHDVAVPVAEDLHLDVPRALDEAFQDDALVAEGLQGLALRRGQRLV